MGNSPSAEEPYFNDMSPSANVTTESAPSAGAEATKPPRQIIVYFIRHGESNFNKAQTEWDVMGMLTKTDHPLTDQGICQCEELRARIQACEVDPLDEAEAVFLTAETIYCSPLTRAVQTALISNHPLLGARSIPLHLLPEAREIKKVGGRDTHGNFAHELLPRVTTKLREYYGDVRAHELGAVQWVMDELTGEGSDAQWWDTFVETQSQVELRAAQFMKKLQQGPDVAIVVGHSLFFRQVFVQYLSQGCDTSIGGVCDGMTAYEGLTNHKISNCGVVQCVISFNTPEDVVIEKVALVFNTHIVVE